MAQFVNFELCKVITLVNFTKSPQLRWKKNKIIFYKNFNKIYKIWGFCTYLLIASFWRLSPSGWVKYCHTLRFICFVNNCALHLNTFIAPVSFETNLRFLGFWGYPEGGLYACFWMEMGNFVFKSEFLKKMFYLLCYLFTLRCLCFMETQTIVIL